MSSNGCVCICHEKVLRSVLINVGSICKPKLIQQEAILVLGHGY